MTVSLPKESIVRADVSFQARGVATEKPPTGRLASRDALRNTETNTGIMYTSHLTGLAVSYIEKSRAYILSKLANRLENCQPLTLLDKSASHC
eukprot:scaffold49253_cov17-Prasinocladus_malaysianus.AAC.1